MLVLAILTPGNRIPSSMWRACVRASVLWAGELVCVCVFFSAGRVLIAVQGNFVRMIVDSILRLLVVV